MHADLTPLPVRLRCDLQDIQHRLICAGSLAWVRRRYRVNAGTQERVDLEDTDGRLMLTSVNTDAIEEVRFRWEGVG
jgi:hypothetical protein